MGSGDSTGASVLNDAVTLSQISQFATTSFAIFNMPDHQ
jgi:hypothetical protein